MRSFADIYRTACMHKGEDVVLSRLPKCRLESELIAQPDSFYLSSMSLRIFRAGLKHSMVDAKWPAFEKVFFNFDPFQCAYLSDEFIENCMRNSDLIRHLGKLKTIRENAYFVLQQSEKYGGFGRYLADWPTSNIVGLWFELKKYGAHLGGGSSASFLRMVGKDTFMLTNDVVSVLRAEGIFGDRLAKGKMPSSQLDLKAVQRVFNCWVTECGRPLCEVSRIVSMTTS